MKEKTELETNDYDVAIVGGGPAGLSAALTLSRAGKRSVVFDAGEPRNARSRAAHGFLTRDQTSPRDVRTIAREELAHYGLTEFRDESVTAIVERRGGHRVVGRSSPVDVRFVILALGMVDELPPLSGIEEAWGRGVIHCPFCQGWERRGRPWALLALTEDDVRVAPQLLGWTQDLTLLVSHLDRAGELSFDAVTAHGVRVDRRPIVAIDSWVGSDTTRLGFDGGESLTVGALVVRPRQRHTALVQSLDLDVASDGRHLCTTADGETSRAGVYAVGDAASGHQAVMAAASSGLITARAVSHRLTLEWLPSTTPLRGVGEASPARLPDENRTGTRVGDNWWQPQSMDSIGGIATRR